MKSLFTTRLIGKNKQVKNRLVVAPMTTQQSHADGSLSKDESEWLTRLALDGYGMVISCAASISKTATAFHNQLSFANDNGLDANKEVADKMRETGTLSIVQLCHAGARALEELTGEKPHSASSYVLPQIPDFVSPKSLSSSQIQSIVDDFVHACKRVENAGFDGIEIHGANGYLFTQFISTMSNLRTDEYGGNLENRARLCREVIKSCRAEVSPDFIIGFRMSFEGMGLETGLDIDENIQIANWLAEDGVDYIHASLLDCSANTVKYPTENVIKYLRKGLSTDLPLIIPGGITSVEAAEMALTNGADFIGIGRAAIGNRNVPNYFQNKETLPHSMPYSSKKLKEIGISEAFADYIKNAPPLKSLNIINE